MLVVIDNNTVGAGTSLCVHLYSLVWYRFHCRNYRIVEREEVMQECCTALLVTKLWGKVIFSEAGEGVCLQEGLPTGEGSASEARGVRGLADPPVMRKMGGMHPTGMFLVMNYFAYQLPAFHCTS